MGRVLGYFLAIAVAVMVVSGCATTDPNLKVLDNATFRRMTDTCNDGGETNAAAIDQGLGLRALGEPVTTTTQEVSAAAVTSTDTASAADSKPQKIVPGMVISIAVEEDHALDRQFPVPENGVIDFPPIGRIQVAGMTTDDLTQKIKQGLEKDLFQSATVAVSVDQAVAEALAPKLIYLLGSVGRPGPMILPKDESFTVMKAIVAAGGCGQFSNCKKVELMRYCPDGKKYKTIVNVERIMTGYFEEDLPVQDKDWIIVPEKIISW